MNVLSDFIIRIDDAMTTSGKKVKPAAEPVKAPAKGKAVREGREGRFGRLDGCRCSRPGEEETVKEDDQTSKKEINDKRTDKSRLFV